MVRHRSWLCLSAVLALLNSGLQTARAAETERKGPGYIVKLSHEEVQLIAKGGHAASGLAPEIAPAIETVIALVVTIDLVGGNKGVIVAGVIGIGQQVVIPQGLGDPNKLLEIVVDAQKWLNPNVLCTVGAFKLIKLINPLSHPGEIKSDEAKVGDQERFILVTRGKDKVALISTVVRKYVTADDDDKRLRANRDKCDWAEEFEMITHPDGKVSFKSWMKKYVSADANAGKRLTSTRDAIGEWEKFTLEYQSDGTVALKDYENKYTSVEPPK
jgi:hypothetical protein